MCDNEKYHFIKLNSQFSCKCNKKAKGLVWLDKIQSLWSLSNAKILKGEKIIVHGAMVTTQSTSWTWFKY